MPSILPSPFLRPGRGRVPATPLLSAAWKELLEIPTVASSGASSLGLGSELDFSTSGVSIEQFRTFFNAAVAAAKKAEPIVEAGNKYSVSGDFAKLNGELLLHEIEQSQAYAALSKKDQTRALEFFTFMCLNGELRNRNPLHPNHLDSAVLGNLMNFPKHIFGFPFAGYATNGNEALSLLLFSYRSECMHKNPFVVYVAADDADVPKPDIQACVERLNMQFHVVRSSGLTNNKHLLHAAVVMMSFGNPELQKVSSWAVRNGISLHIHVLDHEIRSIFSEHPEPMHFDLPNGVRSMSLQDGLFRSAYQLYKDAGLRDAHMDLPLVWQSAYISPNEGGSGNTTPLYIDFCFMLLGWSALHDIAIRTTASVDEQIQPMVLAPYDDWKPSIPVGKCTLQEVLDWGKAHMKAPKQELQENVLQFQRHFVGGKSRCVEAVLSGGGTRSGNLAFESVLLRAKAASDPARRVKVICGNPHLLVERAERRFQFEVVRIPKEGAICIDGLKHEILDPAVGAVYAQTLSITDGITDPLHEILAIVEEENQRRQSANQCLITLINDCCLALSVLLHNDGTQGHKNLRVLDLTENCITPSIVMLDAHKHLGADKGMSMAMGTLGTLSRLTGHVKVGAQPSNGELVRAMADMLLVGIDGYYAKYAELGAAVDDVTQKISNAGMTIVHVDRRHSGSTAFGVEDASGCIQKTLKKRGHGPSPLYGLAPDTPSRCQTGFLLSLTPHALREVKGGKIALDVFLADLLESHRFVNDNYSRLATFFRESSLPAFLLSGGNEELWLFELLRRPGLGRDFISLMLRRLYSGILDSGVICSDKNPAALQTVARRSFSALVLLSLALIRLRKRRVARL